MWDSCGLDSHDCGVHLPGEVKAKQFIESDNQKGPYLLTNKGKGHGFQDFDKRSKVMEFLVKETLIINICMKLAEPNQAHLVWCTCGWLKNS